MSYDVYILYSKQVNQYYTGFSGIPVKRLKQHVAGQGAWTAQAADWRTVFSKWCKTRLEARNLEKRIKARGAKRFLGELKQT
ncbi:MAG: GIY-YIG nuclease family protein [Verrucomicrobia bacterium]|nr:GIY-YIG nuclease family protein [Verrucomicrobiota bacterium]MCG2679730.1 GIY-YIG nuclease family protein [Kiritimatiellia bacterium]MBU4247562.1 GIY-YIG nuclease family protein [Verrucomicrobiota bacterium]MBU4290718.1 GIY-YIG nuclease family protein [Verrucomicrobiota bacterium]MBU4428802.1 GIY-YIG nuclease family protein [Verrucomicrobiota bacterium]